MSTSKSQVSKALACCFVSLLLILGCDAARDDVRSPSNRALIVAIAQHAKDMGWPELNSLNDVSLIHSTLRRHDFKDGDIRVVRDQEATRHGILNAFREHLLEPAGEGDAVVFHFSGRGQKITDDDGDELDGYDESLVPYDAPHHPAAEYNGDQHLRDDELIVLFHDLRRKLGATGSVTVFLDAGFYAGSEKQGIASVRAGQPIGPRRESPPTGAQESSGLYESPPAVDGGSSELAPFVVYSASRHDQPAYETKTDDGTPVGSLSLAVAAGLSSPNLETTNRGLFTLVRRETAKRRIPVEPQVEGSLDSAIFSGRAVAPASYFDVVSAAPAGHTITVEPGTIAGLRPGAKVEVHRSGGSISEPSTRLASGWVTASRPLEAEIRLDKPASADELGTARVFVSRPTFGDLRYRVQWQGLNDEQQRSMANAVAAIRALESVDSDPDVMLSYDPASDSRVLEISTATSTLSATGVNLSSTKDVSNIARYAHRTARNQYLRQVALESPESDLNLEVVAVQPTDCATSKTGGKAKPSFETCQLIEVDSAAVVGNEPPALPVDSYVIFRVSAKKDAAHLALLDLMPNGDIRLLWPPSGAQTKTPLGAGESIDLPRLFKTAPPAGQDVFLLVASDRFIDFEKFVDISEPGKGGISTESREVDPFEKLFNNLQVGDEILDPEEISVAMTSVQVIDAS